MYNRVTEAEIAALQAISGKNNVLFGKDISPDYAHDELGGISSMPEVVVRVQSTEEISEVAASIAAVSVPSL